MVLIVKISVFVILVILGFVIGRMEFVCVKMGG